MASAATTGSDVRPEIAASWRRSELSGVARRGACNRLVPHDVDRATSLLRSAGPVLDELEAGLIGSGYSTVLANRDCQIVRRWFDDPVTRKDFDTLNIREGAGLLEDDIGTNALGTVFEIGKPVTINGPEHFQESLQGFSCYGHPIRHPLTRRIEGVLDISASLLTASPLLRPLIAKAVQDIEERLLSGSRESEKRLLAAFQESSRYSARALVAIGGDITISNQAAADLLSADDIALLRILSEEQPAGGELTLELTTGRPANVTAVCVPGTRHGVIFRIVEKGPRSDSTSRVIPSIPTNASAPALVCGLSGTGRSTRAIELGRLPVEIMRAETALVDGEAAWARRFEELTGRPDGSVVVEGIDLLTDALVDLVAKHVDRQDRPQLVLTSGPVDGLTGSAAALAATATICKRLAPLSARKAEIPDLAAAMLSELTADSSVYLTPGALRALAGQDWPGNLRELKAVMTHVATSRSRGGVAVTDLPERYQMASARLPLGALDSAARYAIVTALRAADGNKAKAARDLGISRTTLYSRIRQLRISASE